MLERTIERLESSNWRQWVKFNEDIALKNMNEVTLKYTNSLFYIRDDEGVLAYLAFRMFVSDGFLNGRWDRLKAYDAEKNYINPAKMWWFPGYDKYQRGMEIARVDYIRTRNDYQNQGLGSRLIDALKIEHDMIELLSKKEKIGFYKKRGFIDSGLKSESGKPFMVWIK